MEEKNKFASLAEQAYQILEEKIATLQLKPGQVLSEFKLSDELRIGRSPIREALQRLAYEGLVIILPRRGILVSPINISTQFKIIAVRREVETLMVRTACHVVTERQMSKFGELADNFQLCSEDGNSELMIHTDASFDNLLSESADNEFADKTMRLMRGLTRRFWFKYSKLADIKKSAELHARLSRAIAARDTAAATEALHQHIDHIESLTRATLALPRIDDAET